MVIICSFVRVIFFFHSLTKILWNEFVNVVEMFLIPDYSTKLFNYCKIMRVVYTCSLIRLRIRQVQDLSGKSLLWVRWSISLSQNFIDVLIIYLVRILPLIWREFERIYLYGSLKIHQSVESSDQILAWYNFILKPFFSKLSAFYYQNLHHPDSQDRERRL